MKEIISFTFIDPFRIYRSLVKVFQSFCLQIAYHQSLYKLWNRTKYHKLRSCPIFQVIYFGFSRRWCLWKMAKMRNNQQNNNKQRFKMRCRSQCIDLHSFYWNYVPPNFCNGLQWNNLKIMIQLNCLRYCWHLWLVLLSFLVVFGSISR